MPNWGANEGQEKHRFKIHFGGSNGDLAAPSCDFWVPLWVPFGDKILEKGGLKCTLAPLGSQGGFKATPNRPKSSHLHRNGIYIFDFFEYFVCILCCDLSLASQLNLFCRVCSHSSLSFPMHCRAEHSTVRQSSAQQRLPPSAADQQLT